MDVGVRLKGWEAQVLGYRTERMGEVNRRIRRTLPTFCELLGSASSRDLLPEVPSKTKVSKRPCAAQTL